jgi:sensor histidine kinase YesM/ligand-binding sensor domain-containing protein
MKTKTLCSIFMIILIVITWQISFSQLAGQFYPAVNLSGFPFTITAYGPDNQLPQSEIKFITKKPATGELLLSTANGLVFFNGYEILPYGNELFHNEFIYSRLFYNHQYYQPLGNFENGDLYLLDSHTKLIGRFSGIDIRENLWAVIDSMGILQFIDNENDMKSIVKTGVLFPSFLKYLGKGNFLISDSSNTYLFSCSTNEKTILLRDRTMAAKTDEEMNKTWLLSSSRFYVYDQKGISEIYLSDNRNIPLTGLEVVDHQAIVISKSGMFVVSDKGVEKYTEDDVLPTNSLISVYYDANSGCLFVGTGNKGLLKLQKKLFKNYYEKKSIFFGSFCSVVPYKKSVVFAAGATAILEILPDKPLRAMDVTASFSTLSVYNDTLFAGTWANGLYLISTYSNRVLAHIPLRHKNTHAIFRDSKGIFWTGTNDGVFTGKHIMRLKRHLPDKITMRVTTIYETKNGQLWLGGSDGIVVLDNQGNIFLRFRKSSDVNAGDIRSFYEDHDGKMWIGTYGGGLYCYNGKKLISLAQKSGYMLGNDVFTLARDTNGYFFMTSNHGLNAVHEEALNRFLNDSVSYLIPFHFGTQSGILNPEFNGGFLNNYATFDHLDFYFPSVQGIILYRSEPIIRNENKLKITKVLVDNVVVDNPYNLPRQIQFLQFNFNKVVFSETTNLYYQYQLVYDGNSASWSKPQKGTSVTFSYLKPGKYQLMIRAIDAFNDPHPAVVSYSFYIEPYFYERTDFRIFIILLFVFMVAASTRYRFIKQKQKSEKELEIKLTVSELQLKSVQTQMNPHFIFNSMNVLVQLISSKKLKKAENFAISFSKLLRNILKQTDSNFISINEEIITLSSYLDIHLIRFERSFIYKMNCPDELLPLQIPTMLLQPMIENAILHGIAHADYPCELSIDFYVEESVLCIRICDNGIGRVRSREINSSHAHQPLGIDLIRRKIDLLRVKYNIQVELFINDLDPVSHSGTVVLFKIGQL